MEIKRIVCGLLEANAYVIDGRFVIDPGDDIEKLRAAAGNAEAILLTHGHFDHMLGAEILQKETGAKLYLHEADAGMLTDAQLSAYMAEYCRLGQPTQIERSDYPDEIFGFKVLHTPGHTPGGVCLYNEAEKVLFSGDTLFRAGYGRYDLPGGNVQELVKSLNMLLSLPGDTVVYPGHGEKTTIYEECRRYGR